MTLLEATKGYKSLSGVMEIKNLSGRSVLQIVRLRQKLKEAAEALTNREFVIVQEYADKDADGQPLRDDQGGYKVTAPDRLAKAEEELAAIYGETFDFDEGERLRVTLPDTAVPISPQDVVNLLPFIDFGGDYGNQG